MPNIYSKRDPNFDTGSKIELTKQCLVFGFPYLPFNFLWRLQKPFCWLQFYFLSLFRHTVYNLHIWFNIVNHEPPYVILNWLEQYICVVYKATFNVSLEKLFCIDHLKIYLNRNKCSMLTKNVPSIFVFAHNFHIAWIVIITDKIRKEQRWKYSVPLISDINGNIYIYVGMYVYLLNFVQMPAKK